MGNRQTVQPPLFTGLTPDEIERCHRRLLARIGLVQEVKLSACDLLNLTGVLFQGSSMPAVPTNLLVFRDGVVVRALLGREAADRPNEQTEWEMRSPQAMPE